MAVSQHQLMHRNAEWFSRQPHREAEAGGRRLVVAPSARWPRLRYQPGGGVGAIRWRVPLSMSVCLLWRTGVAGTGSRRPGSSVAACDRGARFPRVAGRSSRRQDARLV